MQTDFCFSHSWLRKLLCAITATFLSMIFTHVASAVNLTVLNETKTNNWSAGTMRNEDTGREFCFAESRGIQASIIRFVTYKTDKDWFIEILNDSWNFRDGTMNFSFEFDDGYQVDLKGKSEGDALTYDLLDLDATLAIFGLLAKNKKMNLKNSNGGLLEEFSLIGSREAMEILAECMGLR
jgi:hypothetical protein